MYGILIAFELDYDNQSDQTEVAKRVARELGLDDAVQQQRHFEREPLVRMPNLEWRVQNLDQDASDMFEKVFQELMYLRAFAVWRDFVPIFYWCADDWVMRIEERVRRREHSGQ